MNGGSTEGILQFDVVSVGLEDCVTAIVDEMGRGTTRWLACINPHSYVEASRRTSFRAALLSADWLIPDGAGIVLASWMLGGQIRTRITGSDVFRALNDRLQMVGGYSVYFLGASDEVLSEIRRRMSDDWPGVKVAGTFSPPFKPSFSAMDIDGMVARINAANADVLWVGMTAPKQEEWIFQTLPRLNIRFAAAVGAVFDFYTGRVKRSHPAFQRLGLEWLPRLLQEPRRLWRRMGVSAPIFLWHVVRERVRRPVDSSAPKRK